MKVPLLAAVASPVRSAVYTAIDSPARSAINSAVKDELP